MKRKVAKVLLFLGVVGGFGWEVHAARHRHGCRAPCAAAHATPDGP